MLKFHLLKLTWLISLLLLVWALSFTLSSEIRYYHTGNKEVAPHDEVWTGGGESCVREQGAG